MVRHNGRTTFVTVTMDEVLACRLTVVGGGEVIPKGHHGAAAL